MLLNSVQCLNNYKKIVSKLYENCQNVKFKFKVWVQLHASCGQNIKREVGKQAYYTQQVVTTPQPTIEEIGKGEEN